MMICRTLSEWQKYHSAMDHDALMGFVPTMGSLHAGHLELIRRAKAENTLAVVSIFVNPTQFNDSDDFEKYPRNVEADIKALEGLADCVFCPSPEVLYPEGCCTEVEVKGISDLLLGAVRPRHFRGVSTVVTKLLNIIRPDYAYFGEKDFQQLLIIKRMVQDLCIFTKVVAHPTVREADGLAMSSRNVRLSAEARKAARILSQAIEYAKCLDWHKVRQSEHLVQNFIAQEPMAAVQSVAFRDADNLTEITAKSQAGVLLLAVEFDKVLLIDQETYPLKGGK